jgi:CDP-4-dehydro-6-deoxyglucose reductase, E1
MTKSKEEIKKEILSLVHDYYFAAHIPAPFEPNKGRVNYAGRVYDERELISLVDSSLDYWLTAGPFSAQFESTMRTFFSSKDFLLVNSGSSANLLMVSTLCSKELEAMRRETDLGMLVPGDEVITPAVTFPTTLAPIVQNHLVPVFVDCEIGTYNIDAAQIEAAIGPKTKAIFVPHTLGNPCDMKTIVDLADCHHLWLLEDSCDALGATFDGKLVGTFGAMASLSFYPAHHISMGEGGGVVVNHPRLPKTAKSLRDWGRDCWCDPGISNTCGKRFGWQLGELPFGYDHKYIYSNIGYNLKATDLQAAIGVAQIEKIPDIVAARRKNFWLLHEGLQTLQDHLILPIIDKRANPSPFGFAVTVTNNLQRIELVQHLEKANIETRQLFGGNIIRQPGFMDIEHRIHGDLNNSDTIMRDTLFVGVSPRLTEAMIDHVIASFKSFFKLKSPVGRAP